MGLAAFTSIEVTDPNNFIDPEQNKKMFDGTRKVLARVLGEVESSWKLRVLTPDGMTLEGISETSFTHAVLFESDMKPPQNFRSSTKLENYMEW